MAADRSFFHAEQIDALAARDFYHGHVVLVGDIRDPAQFGGCSHASRMRGTTEKVPSF